MPPQPSGRKDSGLAAHAALVRPSVLSVEALGPDGAPRARGAGFFVGDGRLITSRHLLEGAAGARCRLSSGKDFTAKSILAEDASSGLAVLSVDLSGGALRPLSLSENGVREGERVLIVGSPQALEGALAEATASGPEELPGFGTMHTLSGRWPPDSSGCPVVRTGGEVVAVATARIAEGRVVRYAVPAPIVRRVLESCRPADAWIAPAPAPAAPYLAGIGAWLEGESEEASRLLRHAAEAHPSDSLGWFLLAEVLRREEDFGESAGAFEKAAALNPDDVPTLLALGSAYLRGRRAAEALEVFKKLLRTRPDDPDVHFHLASAYL